MTNNIQYKLDILNNFFNLEDSLSVKADKQYIQKYYSINRIPYSILHSRSNFVHMGVSQNETFEHEDLLYFDKQLDNLIKQNKFTSVLELASGRGANSKFLAERNPQTYFTGCDISEAQLKFARKYEENLSNLEFIENDFHSLPNVQDASVDLCFIIEAFCYSDTPEKLFAEIYKKLRPGGYFYIADGFL